MKTSSRKKLGAAVVIISPLVAGVLYLSGTPLLSLQESHTSSFPGGVMIAQTYKPHWPLFAVCLLALLGLIVFFWPARKPPRMRS